MKKIPLSCADFTFPLLRHEDSCRLISMLGVEGVDIGFFSERSHIRPDSVAGHESEEGSKVKVRLSDLGLVVSDVFLQTGAVHSRRAANHPDKTEREAGFEMFRRAVDFALACGSRHLTGLPGVSFEGVSDEDSLNRAAEESSRRAAFAAESGLSYSVEAHVGSIAPTPAKAQEFVKLAGNVTLTLDYGHFIYAGFSNADIHPLLDHAGHFHARGASRGRLQAPVSENMIDFDTVKSRLSERGYGGWICLEYVWIDWEGCNRCDNVSETLLLRKLLNDGL
jgi:sugar phosphate isomerase/epimerase